MIKDTYDKYGVMSSNKMQLDYLYTSASGRLLEICLKENNKGFIYIYH
jgi:hypothetical protein